ncbi:MAG: tRNA lysidine(34) synthetase TilS [Candidatus Omnitrophica bacterium]|nr:tRNA lysidine(34) synthetase TilS [Candidatus Omnitrophota bacterium]
MIEKGDSLLVAVSGGCDSTTLLHLLLELKASWKLKLAILHVNHKLRGKASVRDEQFVRALARRVRIPIFVARVEVKQKAKEEKISLEEAAREARYRFFEEMAQAKRANKIVLAHTQDDQAETVLMRIITGTGLQGLQAIRPKRKLNEGSGSFRPLTLASFIKLCDWKIHEAGIGLPIGNPTRTVKVRWDEASGTPYKNSPMPQLNGAYVVRPLIEVPRAEIREFARANRIRFREDAMNRSLQFLRNRIRLKLLPFLERSFNPQVKKALARLPHLLDVDLAFLEETAELVYKRLAHREHAREISFPKQSFLQLKPSIQYRLMNCAVRALAQAELDFEHWNMFLGALTIGRRFQLQFPKNLLVSVSRDAICIRRRKRPSAFFSYALSLGESVYIPEIDATVSCELLNGKVKVVRKRDPSFDVFDGRELSFPLTVRSRKPGDRFQPLGQARPFKLKEFLINRHIPQEEKDRLPIVLSGSDIVWVGGVAMGDAFKVNPKTRQFVRLALASGNQI